MTKFRKRNWLLLLSVLFFLLKTNTATAQSTSKWRIKSRLQASYEFDNNIREISNDSLTTIDSSLKLAFKTRASRRTSRTQLSLSYRGGWQTYFKNSIENKLINDLQVVVAFDVQKFVLGARGNGRLKMYLNDILDYSSGAAELFLRLPPFSKISNELAFSVSDLNYDNFTNFDHSGKQFQWKLSSKVTKYLMSSIQLRRHQIEYNRDAVRFNFESGELESILRKQTDDGLSVTMRLNYIKKFLVNFSYSYRHNDSNSFGFGYKKHQLAFIFAAPLFKGTWLRGYFAGQIKKYKENEIPTTPLDADPEREESNFFILDLSKDLRPDMTFLLRVAFYNNESVLRSRFYRKTLVTTGFDLRF